MKPLCRLWRLGRHFWLLWRSGQLRFRLETFGVYYPALPYAARWWLPSPRVLWLLTTRIRPYARWLEDMESIGERGGKAWWNENLNTRRPDLT